MPSHSGLSHATQSLYICTIASKFLYILTLLNAVLYIITCYAVCCCFFFVVFFTCTIVVVCTVFISLINIKGLVFLIQTT